jgi:hypothetical protein
MERWVASLLPAHRSGFMSQRTRWEHGHLSLILFEVPRLLVAFLRRPSLRGLAMLAELAVPPLSLLVCLAFCGIVALGGMSYAIGSWLPIAIFSAVTAIASSGLFVVWLREGRTILPSHMAMQIPRYALVKAPMYLRFVTHRQRTWIRTERSAPADELARH